MELLNEQECLKYYGGGKFSAALSILVTGLVSLVFGLFDGLVNPKTCSNGR